jgi:hypothetical protein
LPEDGAIMLKKFLIIRQELFLLKEISGEEDLLHVALQMIQLGMIDLVLLMG